MVFGWVKSFVVCTLKVLYGLIFGFKRKKKPPPTPKQDRSENKENVAPNYDQQSRIADVNKDAVAMDTLRQRVDEKDKNRPVPSLRNEAEDEKYEDDEDAEDEEEEETEEEESKQLLTTTTYPNIHDDITTETETQLTPQGSVQRSMRRELTASPFKEQETITQVMDERKGPMTSHTATREEYTHQIGGDTEGFKTPSPIPPRDESPLFKVSRFVPGAANSFAVSETFSKATTTTTSLSSNLSSFNDDLLNLTKKLDAGLNARTPTPTTVRSPTPPLEASPPPVNIPAPPPPPCSNNSKTTRPTSMPSLDFNILDAIESNKIYMEDSKMTKTKITKTTLTKSGHTINVNDEESERFQKLMKAFKPPPEDEGSLTPTRKSKKKMFSSSSFYEEPRHIYPTVEEQVKLCKSIADSLSADTNQTSKGATMYIKRMKRAHKWVTEGPDPIDSDLESPQIQDPHHNKPSFPRLKLVLDPREIQDPIKLARTGIYNEHNVISPDICFELVRDLNSPTGKGAQLFAKRKKKSENWIVDENTVKETQLKQHTELADINKRLPQPKTAAAAAAAAAAAPYKPPPANKLKEINERINPRVKYVKSPWEAALESPLGSCEAAFVEVKPHAPPLADLIWARQAVPAPPLKDIVLPSMNPVLPKTSHFAPSPIQRSVSPSPFGFNADLYKPKVAKGWTGYTRDQSATAANFDYYQQALPEVDYSARPASSVETSYNRLSLDQFNNYNSTPTSWNVAKQRPNAGFKPVRPKSMILTK
uniref:Uncharacterized protein n=1 Tax=Strigamia maritima TaxID=126957 RepID=T1IUM2_STRMM